MKKQHRSREGDCDVSQNDLSRKLDKSFPDHQFLTITFPTIPNNFPTILYEKSCGQISWYVAVVFNDERLFTLAYYPSLNQL